MLQKFSLPGENKTSSNVSKSSPLTDLVLQYFILKLRLMVQQGHVKSRFVQLILKCSGLPTEYCNLISKCNKFGCVYDLSNSLMSNLNNSCNIHDDVDVRFKTITLNYVSIAECGYISLFHVYCCVLFLFSNGLNKSNK